MANYPLNGYTIAQGRKIDFIRFGSGKRHLLILPGLGDGLKTVRGTAIPMALLYRKFSRTHTVWSFSRGEPLPEGFTTRDMAGELAAAMENLGIEKADVLGVSMGGMIAQHLAADYPEKVGRLVLAVTCPCADDTVRQSVTHWMELAGKGDFVSFLNSNLERIYSESYCRKNGWTTPLVALITKPKSWDRFLVQANACLTHDATERLCTITAPTLVIGGKKDRVVNVGSSRCLAEKIPGAKLHIYLQWGHGLYEEAPDFNKRVLDFLLE